MTYQPLNVNVGTSYSSSLDKILLISSGPNLLHIYDPDAATEKTVALSDTPWALSVSPDGRHAAVSHDASIEYVNIATATIDAVISVNLTSSSNGGHGSVVLTNQYLYVFPPSPFNRASSINLSTMTTTAADFSLNSSNSLPIYVSSQSAIYLGGFDSLLHFLKYSVASGPISQPTTTGADSTLYCNGLNWFVADDGRLFSSCGYVFGTSSASSADGAYLTRFPGNVRVQGLATFGSKVATTPLFSSLAIPPVDDDYVGYFDSAYLNPKGRCQLPNIDGASAESHGRQVFFNSTGSAIYVLMQADKTSGLTNDWAVYKIDLSATAVCSPTFSTSSVNIDATGATGTTSITSDTTCLYSATSDSDWISVVSGGYGGGNQPLRYIVRPNSGESRTGTITAGSTTLKITQTTAGSATDLIRLSYHVLAADYSIALDKLVFVTSGPNELHLYDPVTSTDEYVVLATTPLTVSVSVDGLHATVGYDGWLSTIDLKPLSANAPVTINQTPVLLADPGNGNAYFFSSASSSRYLSTYNWLTAATTTEDSTWPSFLYGLAMSQDGTKLFAGGPAEWDISSGPASFIDNVHNSSICLGNVWASEDAGRVYTSCGSVFGVSPSTSQTFTASGTLSGGAQIAWAANSTTQQATAVIPAFVRYSDSSTDSNIRLYADDGLGLKSQTALPGFLVNGLYYTGHGKYAFWNKSGTKLIVVEQADQSANLQSDFGVFVMDLSPNPAGCAVSASSPSSIFGIGGFVSIPVTTAPGCKWSVDLNGAPWLIAGPQISGTGPGTLTLYAPQANTPAHTATISIGGQKLTVSQDGSCSYSLTPSSLLIDGAAHSGTIGVTAGLGCPWSVSSSESWITLSGTSGTGSGTINYMIAPNPTNVGRSTFILVRDSGSVYSSFYIAQSWAPGTVPPPTPLLYVPARSPCRAIDTREPAGPFGGPIMEAGSTRTFAIQYSLCGGPTSATAYSLNVTVVPVGILGYLSLWTTGLFQPLVSTLNSDGRVKAAATIVPAGLGGGVDVYVTHATHVVIDINGYFVPLAPPPLTQGFTYFPITPCRVSDTRQAKGLTGGPAFVGGDTKNIPVGMSACSIAASAQAYALNLTVVPKGVLGYLSDWPSGQTQPLVSALNAPAGAVTANASTVSAGSNGAVSFFASHPTELIVDINGYYGSGLGGLYYYAVRPCRALDTRDRKTPFSGVNTVQLGGVCRIPTTARAVVTNVTVVPQGPLSYLSIWAADGTQPTVSTLNAEDGAVTSNMAITPVSADGAANIFTTNPSHVVVDVVGYFAP